MVQHIVFLGASTAFEEMYPIIQDVNRRKKIYDVTAILDDDEATHGKKMHGIEVAGPLNLVHKFPKAKFIFGIGSYKTRLVRHLILTRLAIPDDRFISLIHPSARIYKAAKISPGAVIYPGVTVCNGANVEAFSVIAFDVVVGPCARIGKYAMVTTKSIILTGASVGRSAFIGVNSVVGERVIIGAGAVVVMGSVVFQDVRQGAIVQGNPARLLIRGAVPEKIDER